MEKNKKEQAEKLQAKLDNLLQTREKKQKAFEKSKQELNAVSKNIDSVKLKLFEMLQSGSDDAVFSNWVKRRISESANPDNGKLENHATAEKANQSTIVSVEADEDDDDDYSDDDE